jgi:short-chain fatty acids transporter
VKLLKAYNHFFEKYFPSPLSIAIILSFLTFLLSLIFTENSVNIVTRSAEISTYWFNGLWNQNLLAFTIHMMLILVLGHILALSRPAQKIINFGLNFCHNTASAVFTITLLTIIVSLFNWGLGLIFGAVFARKIGEHFQKNNKTLNYPLVGAAAYSGMMVWHGGLSGSATLTVAGAGHSLESAMGIIPLTATTFGTMNIFVTLIMLLVLPSFLYFLGKKNSTHKVPKINAFTIKPEKEAIEKTQLLERSHVFGYLSGGAILCIFIYLNLQKIKVGNSPLTLINLETTNLLLLGLCFIFHQNIVNFSSALEEAISGASGILIQFPIYFGIMGMMQSSGLGTLISQTITQTATESSLAIYTFMSAGLVNIFIPSGGGQWQMQGPIIVEAAQKIGADLPKLIMALCYGDQLTNMLQPFWALPLLGITGLKAKEILPYTLMIFLVGTAVFLLALIIF